MSRKTDIAKKVFAANPKMKEVFVCENGNAFEAESRALAHAREHEVKFLGGINRAELKDKLVKEADHVVKTTEAALEIAKDVTVSKGKVVAEAEAAFDKAIAKGKTLDGVAKKTDEELKKATEAKKAADEKAKTTNTDEDKKSADTVKTALTKAQQKKADAEKAALNQTTVEINKAETVVEDAKKEQVTAAKQVEKLEIALNEAVEALTAAVE